MVNKERLEATLTQEVYFKLTVHISVKELPFQKVVFTVRKA